MEVLGVSDMLKPGEEVHVGADYKIEKTPDWILNKLPEVFKNGPYTFKRKIVKPGGEL